MNQIVLRIGSRTSEFYFPQSEIGFLGIEEVIHDITHNQDEVNEAVEWCKGASLGDKLLKEKFNLEIRA